MSVTSDQIQQEINRLPDREFGNLTRSTIPLLCYWSTNAEEKFTELCRCLSLDAPSVSSFRFGFEVASIPQARASETDLMITSPGTAIAVEAKWSEPRYETIANWSKKTERWRTAVDHWLNLIGPFAEVPGADEVNELVYQMLHRCGSACSAAGKEGTAAIVYQVFVDRSHSGTFYATDLANLVRLLKPQPKLRVALQKVEIRTTQKYADLKKSLSEGNPDTVRVIRDAVRDAELFEFGPVRVERLA